MFTETMVFADTNAIKRFWLGIQLRAYTMLSSGNAFIGCQYFTVRGLRTLNGKMIQHALAQDYLKAPEFARASLPIPSRISYHHFMDESHHFNSSRILSHEVVRSLKPPTRFEQWIANKTLMGCQQDHFHFSAAIKGIFWHDPALFPVIYKLFRSGPFGMEPQEAKEMVRRCFTEESEGLHESARLHQTAVESYRAYLEPLDFVSKGNKEMRHMRTSTLEGYLRGNRSAFLDFERSL